MSENYAMTSLTHIRELAQQKVQTVIDITKELVKVPSVGDVDSLEPMIKKLASIADTYKLPYQILRSETEGKEGFFVGDSLSDPNGYVISSGMSTVNLEEGIASKFDPYKPVVENGKLYGSGAWKNKGNVALSLCVKMIMDQLGFPQLTKLIFSDETSHLSYGGLETALEKGLQGKMHIVSCPLTINKDGYALMYTGCRGFLRYKVTVNKKNPDNLPLIWDSKSTKISPIDIFNEFWTQLQGIFGENNPDPSFPGETINNQYIFGLNAGSGDAIPTKLHAVINVRSTFTMTHREYMIQAKTIAQKICQILPFHFEFEVIEDIPAVQLPDTEYRKIYAKNLQSNLGFKTRLVNNQYTDGIYLTANRGWSVSYAETLTGKNQNSFDEYLDLKDIDGYLLTVVQSILEAEGVELTD